MVILILTINSKRKTLRINKSSSSCPIIWLTNNFLLYPERAENIINLYRVIQNCHCILWCPGKKKNIIIRGKKRVLLLETTKLQNCLMNSIPANRLLATGTTRDCSSWRILFVNISHPEEHVCLKWCCMYVFVNSVYFRFIFD